MMNWKSLAGLVSAAAVLATPALASAAFGVSIGGQGNGFSFGLSFGTAACASTLCYIGTTILYIINGILVPVLFALSFIAFLYGIAKTYIFSRGEQAEVEKGHKIILWGLIGFVVMISVWGLVNVVSNTFGLAGYTAPILPTSQAGIPPALGV